MTGLWQLGPKQREPFGSNTLSAPLYITLLNTTPGTNADVTVTFVSDPGPFGLGGGGYALYVEFVVFRIYSSMHLI